MIQIEPVPANMIATAWPDLADLVLRGLMTARESVAPTLERLVTGEDQLWVVAQSDPLELRAAFVTRRGRDDGRPVVILYGLAGVGAPEWAEILGARMVSFARDVGAVAVQFAGRSAWSRVVPGVRLVRAGTDYNVYERAAI